MTEISIEINIEENKWQEDFPHAEEIIKKSCISALNEAGFQAKYIEISILLTNDESIKKLNHNYRHKDKPTNVLSFPLEELIAGDYKNIDKQIAIGDIIFAFETIKNEAFEQDKSIENHLAHLAVHGTLHLIGYDHEDDDDAEIMEALEVKVLAGFGVGSPY